MSEPLVTSADDIHQLIKTAVEQGVGEIDTGVSLTCVSRYPQQLGFLSVHVAYFVASLPGKYRNEFVDDLKQRIKKRNTNEN